VIALASALVASVSLIQALTRLTNTTRFMPNLVPFITYAVKGKEEVLSALYITKLISYSRLQLHFPLSARRLATHPTLAPASLTARPWTDLVTC
jgi:hypothetical protein